MLHHGKNGSEGEPTATMLTGFRESGMGIFTQSKLPNLNHLMKPDPRDNRPPPPPKFNVGPVEVSSQVEGSQNRLTGQIGAVLPVGDNVRLHAYGGAHVFPGHGHQPFGGVGVGAGFRF